MSVLTTVPWGAPARALVSYLKKEVDYKYPTFILIRHSEREEPQDIIEILGAQLTPRGKKAAFEFGKSLPANLIYHFYHSPVERCKETSTYIQKGIQEKKGMTKYCGELETLMKIEGIGEKIVEYIGRDDKEFIQYWANNQYPTEIIEPAVNLAQRTFSEIMKISQKADPNVINILVSHDLHVLNYMFYWANITKCKEWIQYLEGFILQLAENKIFFYHKDGKVVKDYPYWVKKFKT